MGIHAEGETSLNWDQGNFTKASCLRHHDKLISLRHLEDMRKGHYRPKKQHEQGIKAQEGIPRGGKHSHWDLGNGGSIWGCHHGSAVGIYCAEATEANESIIRVTQQNTVPPKMPTALESRKTAGHGLRKAVRNEVGKWAPHHTGHQMPCK